MRRKQFTPEKVIGLLRQAEVELAQGKRVGEVCRILGISEQSYYRWSSEYGGLKTRTGAAHEGPGEGERPLEKSGGRVDPGQQILKEALEGNF
jgi:putative transposase